MFDQGNIISSVLILLGLMALPVALIYGFFCIIEGESPKNAFLATIVAIVLAAAGYFTLPNPPPLFTDSEAIKKVREMALNEATNKSYNMTYVMDTVGKKLHGADCTELTLLESWQTTYTERTYEQLALEGYMKCDICNGGD